MLEAERGELAPNGQIGNGRSFDNVKPTQGGNSADYTKRRLKRDHTQDQIAQVFGVDRRTVGYWLGDITTIGNVGNGCIPDSRVKVPRGEAGEK